MLHLLQIIIKNLFCNGSIHGQIAWNKNGTNDITLRHFWMHSYTIRLSNMLSSNHRLKDFQSWTIGFCLHAMYTHHINPLRSHTRKQIDTTLNHRNKHTFRYPYIVCVNTSFLFLTMLHYYKKYLLYFERSKNVSRDF